MVPASNIGPDMARNIVLEAHATIASTSVLLWDILLNAREDYQQIRRHGFFKLSGIIYCVSRLTCLFYMVALCVVQILPIGNCAWVRYISYVFPFTIPITLLLFLIRVYALFRNKKYLPVFVFLSWVLVLGSSIAVAIRTEGMNINGTKFCTKVNKRDISDLVSVLIRFFHDTLVFTVTSWWLFRLHTTDYRSFKTVVFARHLLPLTRSLLHDGQAYYLTTLILTVVVIALQLVPKPFVTPGTLGGPLLVLISNMTAHVYRNLLHAKYCGHREFLQWVDADWHPRVIGRYVNETNSNCYRNQAKTDTSSDLQF